MATSKALNFREIMITVILGVACGFLYFGLDPVYTALKAVHPAAGEAIYGLWFIAAALVAYIVQKPFVAIIAELGAAIIEALMGGYWGLTTVWYGLAQGVGVELIFLVFGYRRVGTGAMMLGGVLAAIGSAIIDYTQGTFADLATKTLLITLVVRFISGAILCGLLAKIIVDLLAKTGVLNSYAIIRKKASNPFES